MQDTNTIPGTCTSNYVMSKMIYFHPSKLGEYLKKNLYNRPLVYRVHIHFFNVFPLIV